ncbi:hypothetical protein P3X46_031258 [Hevea brasiliensis]|uniref:Uncharacterized protein n=1 Tax=Hevea brasiliensis TaxID=3981 RepID=A0ABQ9KJR6_HEVBR|nr:hypothetical protein P3X46_031258 [Hevea brasiliensis]
MEDVLTEIPPPSRFFQEAPNNLTTPPTLPSPFLLFSNPKPDLPLCPSLLISLLLRDLINVVAKLLIGEQIIPARVLILDLVQSYNLSSDETCSFQLETLAERKGQDGVYGGSSLLKGVGYFPLGSMVDGLAAALLARCQMRNSHLSWPEYGGSVVTHKSILQRTVLHGIDLSSKGDAQDKF